MLEHHGPADRLQKVGGGPRKRREHHVAVEVPEVTRIDRHGLGPAEDEARAARESGHQDKRPGHEHGADGIDVWNGIGRHAAENPGGVVAKLLRRPAVRGLMERDGEDERNGVDADDLNGVFNHGRSKGFGVQWKDCARMDLRKGFNRESLPQTRAVHADRSA